MNRTVSYSLACSIVLLVEFTSGLGVCHGSVRPQAESTSAASTPSPQIEGDRLTAEFAASEARLAQRIAQLKPEPAPKSTSGWYVVLGALIAAATGYLTQRAKVSADDRLSRRTSGRQVIADIMTFRSRQLNEFYAPLRALLGQGLGIRNQLYDQLLANPLAGYNFYLKGEAIAATGQSLWYTHGGVDKPFRMIDDLGLLNQQLPHLLPLVDEILKANDAAAKVILEHGGLALPDNDKLTDMLGAYLAHHAILKQIRATVSCPVVVKYTKIFPRGFDKVIQQDFEKLADELRVWQNSAQALAAA